MPGLLAKGAAYFELIATSSTTIKMLSKVKRNIFAGPSNLLKSFFIIPPGLAS